MTNQKKHFYIQKEHNKPEELKKKCTGENKTIRCTNTFWTTLRFFTIDCKTITDEQIKRIALRTEDLKKFVEKYIACTGGVVAHDQNISKGTNALSFYFAPGLTMLKFKGADFPQASKFPGMVNGDFGTAFTIQAGMTFEKRFRLNPRFSLNLDLGVRYYSAHSDNTFRVNSSNSTDRQVYDINPTYIKLSPSAKYLFSTSGLRPYIRGGFSANYILSFSSKYELTEKFDYGVTTITTADAVSPTQLNKLELGYYLGFGVTKEKFGFELRGELGSGVLAENVATSSTANSLSLYLAYQITRND